VNRDRRKLYDHPDQLRNLVRCALELRCSYSGYHREAVYPDLEYKVEADRVSKDT